MKLITNTGSDRVIDELRQALVPPSSFDMVSPAFSLFAFAELRDLLEKLDSCRVVLPATFDGELGLTGSEADRAFRNRLQLRWLALECADWIRKKVEIRRAPALLPQSIFMAGKPESERHRVITGNCAFTTEGLGITPGNQFSLIQDAMTEQEDAFLASLAISGLPHHDLFALYQGWLDRLAAYEAAEITGSLVLPNSADRASAIRDGLDDYMRLQREIVVLRAQATKEKQINRRVELNLEVKRLETELTEVAGRFASK